MHEGHEAEEVSPKFQRSCKLNRSESGYHLWKRFVNDGKHGQVYWSRTSKTISMRSGFWPLLTREVTLAWTLKFTVGLWNDWTSGQSSMISTQCSQLCGVGKGGTQCRLPCDFPVKYGSWIYFINVGMCLLMCSGKLCCAPDFGDICSWKCNFGVGKYA